MKIIILSAILFVSVSCSTPKYSYYFDHYSVTGAGSSRQDTTLAERNKNKILVEDAPWNITTAQQEAAVASSESAIVYHNAHAAVKNPTLPAKEKTNKKRVGIGSIVKELRSIKKSSTDPVKEGDPKKNAFAIIGFILGFTPLFLLGIVFCIIGLKSQHRGLAKAGLITTACIWLTIIALAIWISTWSYSFSFE